MTQRIPLVVLLTAALAGTAHAGIFFNRKTDKPNPADRVPDRIRVVGNRRLKSAITIAEQNRDHPC